MVSDEIIKILDAFANKIGVTVNWTQDNILPYMQKLCGKYVTYEMATSVFWIVIGVFLLLLGKYLITQTKNCWVKYKENAYSDYDFLTIIFSVLAVFSIMSGIAVVGTQTMNIIACLTFPEKVILDELQSIYQSLNAK